MKSKINRIIKEVNLWTYAAISLPLIALAGLFFVKFIGFEAWIDKLLVVGATAFFIVSVIWWWWAISKIAFFASVLDKVQQKFSEVKQEVKDIRKDL